jgi:hypothetical protein
MTDMNLVLARRYVSVDETFRVRRGRMWAFLVPNQDSHRTAGPHPQRSYALSAKTSVPANSPPTQSPLAAVTESSLNVEPRCIKVVDTFRTLHGSRGNVRMARLRRDAQYEWHERDTHD